MNANYDYSDLAERLLCWDGGKGLDIDFDTFAKETTNEELKSAIEFSKEVSGIIANYNLSPTPKLEEKKEIIAGFLSDWLVDLVYNRYNISHEEPEYDVCPVYDMWWLIHSPFDD